MIEIYDIKNVHVWVISGHNGVGNMASKIHWICNEVLTIVEYNRFRQFVISRLTMYQFMIVYDRQSMAAVVVHNLHIHFVSLLSSVVKANAMLARLLCLKNLAASHAAYCLCT